MFENLNHFAKTECGPYVALELHQAGIPAMNVTLLSDSTHTPKAPFIGYLAFNDVFIAFHRCAEHWEARTNLLLPARKLEALRVLMDGDLTITDIVGELVYWKITSQDGLNVLASVLRRTYGPHRRGQNVTSVAKLVADGYLKAGIYRC